MWRKSGAILIVTLLFTACRPFSSADAPGQSAAAQPLGPSTFDLIHQALDAGSLSPTQALLYEAYATFGGQSIPSQYRGDPRNDVDSTFAVDASRMWDVLSANDRDQLLPWMLPGYVAGSWWDVSRAGATSRPSASRQFNNKSPDAGPDADIQPYCDKAKISSAWTSKSSPSGKVKVWWPAGNAKAAKFGSLVTSVADEAWDKVKSLTGREPKEDEGGPCEGGDKSYDVVIDPRLIQPKNGSLMTGGMTATRQGICPSPSYTNLFLGLPADQVRLTLVHELTHAVQYGTGKGRCDSFPGWFLDGMAVWAEVAAYPKQKPGKQYGLEVLKTLHLPLEAPSKVEDLRDYGMWLMFYDFVVRSGVPDFVKSVLHYWDQGLSPIKAIDAAGNNDYLWHLWRQFALDAWNQNEHDEWSRPNPWASYPNGAYTSSPNAKQDSPDGVETRRGHRVKVGTYTMIKVMGRLSARYYRYDLRNAKADHVHWITFKNPYFNDLGMPSNGASVQALIHRNGLWITQDWTQRTHVDLCLDKPDQRLDDLVMVFSSSAPDKLDPADNPELIAKDSCPKVVGSWVGDVTQTVHTFSTSGSVTQAGYWPNDITYTTTAKDVRFTPRPIDQHSQFIEFVATGGTVTETVAGTIANCTIKGDGSISIGTAGTVAGGSLTIEPRDPSTGKPDPAYEAAGMGVAGNSAMNDVLSCPENPNHHGPQPGQLTEGVGAWFGTAGRQTLPTKTVDGKTVVTPGTQISGTATYSSPDGTTTQKYSWSFRYEADEPLIIETCTSQGGPGPGPQPSPASTPPPAAC